MYCSCHRCSADPVPGHEAGSLQRLSCGFYPRRSDWHRRLPAHLYRLNILVCGFSPPLDSHFSVLRLAMP